MTTPTRLLGTEALTATLRALADRGPTLVAGALFRESERVMTDAKRRTPVETGALRSSGQVQPPEVAGSRVTVTLGFGNSSVGYAIYVHENLRAHHPVGEAKYLERPLLEAVRGMDARLADDIRKEVERAAR